jgi:peptidoglycan hydrolase-like protein with peptidoglycan-binding domain
MAVTTADIRRAWAKYLCTDSAMAVITIYGGQKLQVNRLTLEAWAALSAVFEKHGYKADPKDTGGPGAYNCRNITGGTDPSTHAYGVAADINPSRNPYAKYLKTDMTRSMINDVEGIRTNNGARVFRWGGDWNGDDQLNERVYDPMHFEIIATPNELKAGIDMATIPGDVPKQARVEITVSVPVLSLGAKGSGTRVAQVMVGAKVDGGFGPDTEKAVRAAQKNAGLKDDGVVGKRSWAVLLGGLA